MKIRKIMAAAAAAVVGAFAVTATAGAYEAFLMYTDNSWGWGCWSVTEFPAGNVDVTGDGTYTVYIDNTISSATFEDEETGEDVAAVAAGATVFCVDIEGLATDYNAGKDAEGYEDCQTGADKMAFAKAAGIEVSDVKITTTSTDGTSTEVAVNQDNIIFGDIEGNGKIRIEIINAYGDTASAPAVNVDEINFDESISVTFTITGLDGDAADAADDTVTDVADTADDTVADNTGADDTAADATTADKGSPDTGVEGIAAVAGVAALAAGALIVAKKKK